MKIILLVFILVSTVLSLSCNATMGNYISPHSLGQQDEMNDTLAILCPSLKIQNVFYDVSKANYTISNISVTCLYFDGAQQSEIGEDRTIKISGGRVEFMINYNFSISKIGPDQTGYGYASTIVSAPSFKKKLGFTDQHAWILEPGSTSKLNISTPFVAKRTQPSNITDDNKKYLLFTINEAPKNVITQITEQINAKIEQTLNKTLREETVFNDTVVYKYPHFKNETLEIKYTNFMYKIILNPTDGLIIEYLSTVDGYPTTECTSDIPDKPHPFNYYGGIQTIIHTDLVRQTVQYLLDKKWLDVELNSGWDSNGFQFFAGDLFDIIPKVKGSIAPRTRIAGGCYANKQIVGLKRSASERYKLELNYECQLYTQTDIKIADFDLNVSYILRISLNYESLNVKIQSAEGIPTFRAIDGYIVDNINLATFKIHQALQIVKEVDTVGTGFPTWPRDHPNVEVNDNYTLLYDSSHIPHLSTN